jgi:raffinose/stachyose/melibiose transport system substrate-binding protein
MKRKWSLTAFATIAVMLTATACGSNSTGGTSTPAPASTTSAATTAPKDTGTAKKNVTINLFQFKVEIAEQLSKLVAEYEKETGVKIKVETVGGGADYGAALKAKFNSGSKPDIFNNGGYSDLNQWIEQLDDLSGEPWVKDLAQGAGEPMTKNGKLYGMPVGLEGYGYIYNKDLFAQAGITELPKTLTQLEDAAKKLQAKGTTPFVNGYAEWWVLGNHLVNTPFSNQPNADKFIQDLYAGTAKMPGNKQFDDWVKLIDLTIKYGNKNPLQTDYNTEVTDFATGKAAMMQQGNWTQVQISKTNPNIKIGFLPMPISDDAASSDKLQVGVPNNWVVYKDSPVKDEAKKFLNWLVSSATGKKYITNEFKFIPAFKSIPVDEQVVGPLAADIIKYSNANKTLSWNWFKFPGGEATSKKFSDAMQAYIGGKIKKDQMLDEFQKSWDSLKK